MKGDFNLGNVAIYTYKTSLKADKGDWGEATRGEST